ncbi:MAG TPA: hypothetical protein DCM38_05650 [Gammaproteobacteria bacterium]|nr:hypothetical protein [Gammaproteobacteria bacterium]
MSERQLHCLRPIFTQNLINTLQQGRSVNLIAPAGQGRRRLLEDIKSSPKNARIPFLDMKSYTDNYDGFIQALWQQLDEKGEQPTDFGKLITTLESRRKKIIILLHHFDELLDNSSLDKRFDVNFFNQLNSIQTQDNVSLLCLTSEPHDQSFIFIKGKQSRFSWLDLEKKRLPKLSYEEICLELKSRELPISSEELSLVAWAVPRHEKPYLLLKSFADKIKNQENNDLELSSQLKIWREQFQVDNS